MKTKIQEFALDWESLPLLDELNSEDEQVRREAEEFAFRILWRNGMVYVKSKVNCSKDEAEDMVQEAIIDWMKFVRKLGPSNDSPDVQRKSHKGLFYTILKCKIANWFRKRYKSEKLEEALGANANSEDPGTPIDSYSEREIYALELIDDLEPKLRSIVLMKIEGRSFEEIAETLGISSASAAKAAFYRTMETIRQKVEVKFGPFPKDKEPKEAKETKNNQAPPTDPPAKDGGPVADDEGKQP